MIDRKDPISCVRMQALATTSTIGYTINEFEIWSGPKPPPTVGQIIPVPVKQSPAPVSRGSSRTHPGSSSPAVPSPPRPRSLRVTCGRLPGSSSPS